MNIILCGTPFIGFIFLLFFGPTNSLTQPSETDIIDLKQTQRQDRSCLKKFDKQLEKLWDKMLNDTKIGDLGDVPTTFIYVGPSKPKYNTIAQEWLMEDANPTLKLETCFAGLYNTTLDAFDNETLACAKQLFGRLIEKEKRYAGVTKRLLTDETALPFREFLSFVEADGILFQNRIFDEYLTSHEKNTRDHMASYVPSSEDENERTWVLRQECDWKDLKEFQDAGDDEERVLDIFKTKLLRSVNRDLGNKLIRNIDLSANISRESLDAWLNARKNMLAEVETTIQKLKSAKKDVQWLCEYASEVANKYSMEQARILVPDNNYYIELRSNSVVYKAKDIEEQLKSLNDTRLGKFKDFVDSLNSKMHCWSSLKDLLVQHQAYEIAERFIGNDLSYPQLYCRDTNLNLGLLTPEYCKCVGTFCVAHEIASLFAERLKMVKNEDGTYSVETTNVTRPTQKVVSWPGVKEI